MSTAPDNIPADILQAAEAALRAMQAKGTTDEALWIESYAKAILAERERMAALLKDPASVRINYLRGAIACQNLIDEAVAAERERCAQIAEKARIVSSAFADGYVDIPYRRHVAGLIRGEG